MEAISNLLLCVSSSFTAFALAIPLARQAGLGENARFLLMISLNLIIMKVVGLY